MNSNEFQSPTYSAYIPYAFLEMLEYIAENPDGINQLYAAWILESIVECGVSLTREFQNVLFKLGFVIPGNDDIMDGDGKEEKN